MPLHVLIIGAGIAGLGAAIGLAREGHKVTVIEKSSFAQEVGAALHMGPQANLVLKEWGVDVSTMDPSQYDAFKTVSISEDHSKDFYHVSHRSWSIALRRF
jgi:salicylate hydroxylase